MQGGGYRLDAAATKAEAVRFSGEQRGHAKACEELDRAGTGLRVLFGQVVALRLFDLAYEIDLNRAEEVWTLRADRASERSRLAGTLAKAVSFGVLPLALELGPVSRQVGGRSTIAMAGACLYDFGIAALALRLPVQDQSWTDFTALVNRTNQAVGPAAATNIWEGLLAQLRDLLGEALDRPTAAPLQEDYLIAAAACLASRSLCAGQLQDPCGAIWGLDHRTASYTEIAYFMPNKSPI